MTTIIKNRSDLESSELHRDGLDIIESGLQAIDTESALRRALRIDNGILMVGGVAYQLNDYNNIYVVGAGKVACEAGRVLESIFGDRLKRGAIVGISDGVCEILTTYKGTHPLPSGLNTQAGAEIMSVSESATENDLVIAIIGGGGSALLCSDDDECQQNTELYQKFKSTGAEITEMNTVRKHLSSLKGGGLAKALYPATVIGLVFSDVPGDNLSAVASGPTYYDDSTVSDAQAIIDKYNLGQFNLRETPKDRKYFDRVHNVSVATNHLALDTMKQTAEELGYQVHILSNEMYDDSATVAKKMVSAATTGSVILVGGEWSLKVPAGAHGSGGRNSYLALLAAAMMQDEDQVFAAFASDGHDNSDAAGAFVDSDTIKRIYSNDLDPSECLEGFDCLPALEASQDLIITGYLESNVSDLAVLVTK